VATPPQPVAVSELVRVFYAYFYRLTLKVSLDGKVVGGSVKFGMADGFPLRKCGFLPGVFKVRIQIVMSDFQQ